MLEYNYYPMMYKKGKLAMKKPGRYFLYLLPTALVISAVALGILFRTGVLQKVNAAPGATGNAQKISTLGSILPLRPVKDQVVNLTNTSKLLECLDKTELPLCYTPQQIRQAYGVQPLLDAGITGKGQTIALIEAFDDPTVKTDLQRFDKIFGLPDTQLKTIAPFGVPPFDFKDPEQTGFASETALDTQWAHAMAPDATIVIIQAKDAAISEIFKAVQFAVEQNIGDVISISLGISEQCTLTEEIKQAHASFQQARDQKQTILASAGDSGSADADCDANRNLVTLTQGVSLPASDPLVTSVGGTTLLAGKTGVYQSETTWNEADQGHGATGGGFSNIFAKPDFQQNIPGTRRGVADISFDADPLTGVPAVLGSSEPGQTLLAAFGGTSLGAPAIAGMTALFNQAAGQRLGFLNNALYRISEDAGAYAEAFHDIQSGNNPFVFKDDNDRLVFVDGFNAAPGWDPPTGVGTPNASGLAKHLAKFIKPNDGTTL
jgi:subtilase family serine protease